MRLFPPILLRPDQKANRQPTYASVMTGLRVKGDADRRATACFQGGIAQRSGNVGEWIQGGRHTPTRSARVNELIVTRYRKICFRFPGAGGNIPVETMSGTGTTHCLPEFNARPRAEEAFAALGAAARQIWFLPRPCGR